MNYKINISNEIISQLQTYIASKPEIIFAYLFGSIASGTAGKLSDIDLAIYLDPDYRYTGTGYGYPYELIEELSSLLSTKVDVVVLNKASIILRHQVIKKGILICNRNDAERRVFHEKAVREYLDIKPILKIQSDYLRKRLQAKYLGGDSTG